jgi:transketolase
VLELATVKPLDTAALDAVAASGVRLVVTLEEHSIVGGLGGAVAEHLAEKGCPHAGDGQPTATPALLRLGMPDDYLDADTQRNLLARANLTSEDVARRIAERL